MLQGVIDAVFPDIYGEKHSTQPTKENFDMESKQHSASAFNKPKGWEIRKGDVQSVKIISVT
jgi:hypothetical protein